MLPRPIRTVLLAALFLGTGLAGCAGSDKRLQRLKVGISKDSTLAVMGLEKPQRVDSYLSGGHYIEAMYYFPPGISDSAGTPDRKLSPVIVIDGALAAWGWKQWDSIAAANKIVVAK